MEQHLLRCGLTKSFPRKPQTYSLRGRPLVGRGLKDCQSPAAASPSPTATPPASSGGFPVSTSLPSQHLHCSSACAGGCGAAHAATVYSSAALRRSKRDDLCSPKRTCGGNHTLPDGGQRLWHSEPRSRSPSASVTQSCQTADAPSVRKQQRYRQPFLPPARAAQRLRSFQRGRGWEMGCRGQAFAASRRCAAGRPLRSTVGSTGEQDKAAHQPFAN